jgi:amidohydrolase
MDFKNLLNESNDNLVKHRRNLHSIPEIGFEEESTSKYIQNELKKLNIPYKAGYGKTGVVGVIKGGLGEGRSIMIRADIDGLPLTEETQLDFASKNGCMHACGHDGHISILLETAKIIESLKDTFKGEVILCFQPAEEIVQGAMAMINDGLFDDYKPERVIGLHIWNQLKSGFIGVNDTVVFASADAFSLEVRGRGGHGALPHLNVDPIVAASQIITNAQTVISREVSPQDPGVLTFGKIESGTASNIIPDTVSIQGTIRAYSPKVREQIFSSLKRISSLSAEAMRTKADTEIMFGTPPVINESEVAQWVRDQSSKVIDKSLIGQVDPVSVGDDVAEFINRIPGVYFLLGAKIGDGKFSHHNSKFDFDEKAMINGVKVFLSCTIDFLDS